MTAPHNSVVGVEVNESVLAKGFRIGSADDGTIHR